MNRALFILALLLAGHPACGEQPKPLAITRITVIDVVSARHLKDATVVIEQGKITHVGPFDEITIPKGATVVNGAGKYLIPGLWDMHVHWRLKEYLPLFIANGVTGVRIMWGKPDHHQWRTAIEAGTLVGPRMYIGSAIIDGANPIWPGSVAVANETEARQAVRDEKKSGADFIKVYSLLSREAYFAILDEAKKQAIPVAGHVPDAIKAEEASDSGQQSMEHLVGVFLSTSKRQDEWMKKILEDAAKPDQQDLSFGGFLRDEAQRISEYSEEKAKALFALFVKNRTWQCPTLTVLRSEAFLNEPGFKDDPRLRYMPKSIRDSWDPKQDPALSTATDSDFANARLIYEKSKAIVGEMNRSGVGILAGTDTLNPLCFPGFSLHDELELLVQSGLTPLEALRAATIQAATFMNRADSIGSIAPGKTADLVILNRDPLQDINNTRSIEAVVFGGKLYDHNAIQNMLAEAEKAAAQEPVGLSSGQ